ncbi:WGxxGxxG family protein [Streptomyces zagrosensis]|uniref:MYXO-CTERM domain-containing protein n=1 Tax=Streptomyces zagrosensis TaxID=1042984 RepID=A0A7W9V1D1_9ACTN|nr:WGxxGxxG family protein [Streptomyces zagrosensis]MBB5939153.1 MYXO-CTERM domain-containing protein [Streptomyces zagrosensis]
MRKAVATLAISAAFFVAPTASAVAEPVQPTTVVAEEKAHTQNSASKDDDSNGGWGLWGLLGLLGLAGLIPRKRSHPTDDTGRGDAYNTRRP